ncbi:hypothetical protein GCK72_004241 [Caenorhabditis remanei]|uniref:Uncharacterized protein n=1 Tax=Caenorhabditis remanei TaxID=31234 RepID=A0A6A5HBW4_CAERE|nr:hypothetical protein GCK72_004241 [Caenorhabditis remanei]KAF1764294.1 hypothetical protein GCK72_004241 [Caenorhabditis remanei]
MSDLTCASPDQQDFLASRNLAISQFVDVIAAIITLFLTYPAIHLVLHKSVFQWSTKLLLLQNLIYAVLYQLSYSLEAILVLYKHFFKLGEVCDYLQTEAHCAPYLEFMLTATSGMIYGQTGLMVERVFATFLPDYTGRKTIRVSCTILILVFVCSSITGKLLIWDDPLDGALLACFMFPRASAARSSIYFCVCSFLVLFNFAVSLLLRRYNTRLEYS